jgi:membrane protein DedA with SNARE-associated domain
MDKIEHYVVQFFSQYAYSPWLVYGAICAFMLLSAFGMPIPEELILISAGLVGYMAMNPDQFPPPYEGAPHVNVYVLAIVALGAVLASDYLIYSIGKRMGPRLFRSRWFKKLINDTALEKIQRWMWNYGSWAVFVFRFTPGVRFPGHLTCGAMGLSPWRFIAVDWLAAGISVPTQVLLVAYNGHVILKYFGKFKLFFFSGLAAFFACYIVYKHFKTKYYSRQPRFDSSNVHPIKSVIEAKDSALEELEPQKLRANEKN